MIEIYVPQIDDNNSPTPVGDITDAVNVKTDASALGWFKQKAGQILEFFSVRTEAQTDTTVSVSTITKVSDDLVIKGDSLGHHHATDELKMVGHLIVHQEDSQNRGIFVSPSGRTFINTSLFLDGWVFSPPYSGEIDDLYGLTVWAKYSFDQTLEYIMKFADGSGNSRFHVRADGAACIGSCNGIADNNPSRATLAVRKHSTIADLFQIIAPPIGVASNASTTVTIRVGNDGLLYLVKNLNPATGGEEILVRDTTTGEVKQGGTYNNTAEIAINEFSTDEDVEIGQGKVFYVIPAKYNGWKIKEIYWSLAATGTGGQTDAIVTKNGTAITGTSASFTTGLTQITTVAGSPIVNTLNRISIEVTVEHTTKAQGLAATIILEP